MRCVWLPEARHDVQRLFDFLVRKDPRAARRAVRVIRSAGAKLTDFPRLGKRMDDETRRRELAVPFGAGAYVLRHRIHDSTVVVIRAWQSREDRL